MTTFNSGNMFKVGRALACYILSMIVAFGLSFRVQAVDALGRGLTNAEISHADNLVDTNKAEARKINPYEKLSTRELWDNKPKMYNIHGGGVENHNPDVARMWQWDKAIRKADPAFELKMPIEFYGLVLDQSNQPVADAMVNISCRGLRGEVKTNVTSGVDGRFCITGMRGKGIMLNVFKTGYRQRRSAFGYFEYGDFSTHNYHVPVAEKPCVVKLWRLHTPEPMYKYDFANKPLSIENEPTWIDVSNGQVGESGQVAISVLRASKTNCEAGYSITLKAIKGGGILLSDLGGDELMGDAPEHGYREKVTIEHSVLAGNAWGKKLQLYLKTPDDKYAAVLLDVSQYNFNSRRPERPLSAFSALIYFNPSGSRNLEFSSDNEILPDRSNGKGTR